MKRFLTLFILSICTISSWALGTYYGQLTLNVGSGSGYVLASTSSSATVGALTTSSASNSAFAWGSSTSLTFYALAEAADGYYFAGWATTNGTTTVTYTGSPYTVTVTAKGSSGSPTTTTLYAVFKELPTFYASATAVADASKGSAQVSFTEGSFSSSSASTSTKGASSVASSADLTAYFHATGTGSYAFTGWSETEGGTIISTANPYATTITTTSTNSSNPTNKTLYANFASADPYYFVAKANSTNTTAGSATATLLNGTQVNGVGSASNQATFTATANSGYNFVGWGESASATTYVSTANPYTIDLTNNTANSTVKKILYAFFEEYTDPQQPVSTFPAKNSTVKSAINTVSFTFGQTITLGTYTARIYDKASYDADDWCDPLIYSGSGTLSSDSKTAAFTLESTLQEGGTYYLYLGASAVTLADGTKNTEVLIPFTYASNVDEVAPTSSNPADGVPAEGPLASISFTFPNAITSATADAVKVYGMTSYIEGTENKTYDYLMATSSSTAISADNKTVTFNFATSISKYGDFKVELPYGSVKGDGWTNTKAYQSLILYKNPTVTPASGTEQTSISQIKLTYADTWLNYSDEKFGSAVGTSTAWIKKYKGGAWVNYCVGKLGASKDDNSSVIITPIEVDENGFTTDTIALNKPGKYQIVVPAGSVYTNPESSPVWQYSNQELTITYTIPGDESIDYWKPESTNPADLSQVATQFSTFTMTFPLEINNVGEASNMKVYSKGGALLSTASNVTKSDDNKSVTYTLPSAITTKDTLTVQVALSAVGGDGWLSDVVKRRVIVVERFNPSLSIETDAWKIKSVMIDIDRDSHDTISIAPNQKQITIYKEGGESTGKHIAPNKDIAYDTANHRTTISFLEKGYLLGEGNYYIDFPTGFFRTLSGGKYIYSEAAHLTFTLAPQAPTPFTVDPADGSTMSSISSIKITINDCDTIAKAGVYTCDYMLVSKNGADPIRYALFSSDRDSVDTSNQYQATQEAYNITAINEATINVAEGFKTPIVDENGNQKDVATYDWQDTYGYKSSGTYTITIPAKVFKIDDSYYNTEMTFTYIVENNVVEQPKFEGKFDITPESTDTIVNIFSELQTINVHFRNACTSSITSLTATVTGKTSKVTYLKLQSYEQVDSAHWNFIMEPQSVTEHQDDNVTLTFTGEFVVNGKTYIIDTDDNMDYNYLPITQSWRYMTPEAYAANTVTFSPEGGATQLSISKVSVTPTDEYKFLSNFNWPAIQVYRNGEELSGYTMVGVSSSYDNTGSLQLYKGENKATLAKPGVYTIKVPAGYFPLQNKTSYKDAFSKEETLTFTINVDVKDKDGVQDGKLNIKDLTNQIHIISLGTNDDTGDLNADDIVDTKDVNELVKALLNAKE